MKHTEYDRLRDGGGRAPGLIGWFPDMSVTFVDNHDTGSTQQVGRGPDFWASVPQGMHFRGVACRWVHTAGGQRVGLARVPW